MTAIEKLQQKLDIEIMDFHSNHTHYDLEISTRQTSDGYEEPLPEPTFHTEVDEFGNVKYFDRKEIIELQLKQLGEQREKLLNEEKYELLIELEEIYDKLKKEYDKL